MAAGRFHIIIDVNNVPDSVLSDEEKLNTFLNTLPGTIGMTVLKGPVITSGIPENPGLSGFVIIDFSHISIHTFTDHKQVLVDIFSCKPYDQEVAKNAVMNYLGMNNLESANIQQVSWE
ncbi:MAG: S-adenosylmethionine decarboxylase [Candidatus Daviesbacteria bacterium]|nr:MAG: S-adenosylmethionine decarboxylase [Candidatus Daviesbacteria bacterium]